MSNITVTPNELYYLSQCTSWNCCRGLEDKAGPEDTLNALCDKHYAVLDDEGILHLDVTLTDALKTIDRSLQSIRISFISQDVENRILLHVDEKDYTFCCFNQKENLVHLTHERHLSLPLILIACSIAICGDKILDERTGLTKEEIHEIQEGANNEKVAPVLVRAIQETAFIQMETICKEQGKKECHIFKKAKEGTWKVYEQEDLVIFEGIRMEIVLDLLRNMLKRKGVMV